MFKKYALFGLLALLALPFALPRVSVGRQGYLQTISRDSTLVSGYISENTTWTLPNSPYVVEGNVIVESGVFLTIEAGVVIRLANGTGIIVDGGLIAQGSSTNEITFTSNATTPALGDWSSIRFRSTAASNSSLMDWIVVEYGDIGVTLESTSQTFSNSTFRFNNCGIEGSSTVLNCTFESNNVGCNYMGGGSVQDSVFENNTIGVIMGPVNSEVALTIFRNCTFARNLQYGISTAQYAVIGQLELFNSSVSYNGNDGIHGGIIKELYMFESEVSDNNGFGINSNTSPFLVLDYWRIIDSEVSNNSLGGIRQDSDHIGAGIIMVNSKVVNNSGDGIYKSAYEGERLGDAISYSDISNNNGTGFRGLCGNLTDSKITSNGENGVEVVAYGAYIERAIITQNNETGILVSSESGECSIRSSNINDNGVFDLRNAGPNTVNATYNWWGTTNETLIKEHIYDYYDDYNVGAVLYNPYLDAPISEDTMPPVIDGVSRVPDGPDYNQNVNVTAVITDNVAVDQGILSYTSSVGWYNVSMIWLADNTYSAVIPAFPYDTTVQYKVYANDTSGNEAVSEVYSYTVGDFVVPEIQAVEWRPTCPYPYVASNVTRANEPTLITANVTEPVNASGVAFVQLFYRADGGEWWNTTMSYNSTSSLYCATIPGQKANATVQFFVTAYDNAGNVNTSSTTAYTVKPLLVGDIDGDGKVAPRDLAILIANYGDRAHYP